jgi:HlyD family secretion protein
MKNKKRLFVVIFILVVVIGAASVAAVIIFGKSSDANMTTDEEQILTTTVKEGTVSVKVDGPSVAEPYKSQDIRSRTSGLLLRVPVEGDRFEEGAVLIRFDQTEQEEAEKQAELNLAQARIDLQKSVLAEEKAKSELAEKENLLKGGAVAQSQVDAAKEMLVSSDLAVASSELKINQMELLLQKARNELVGTTLTAPFTGIALKAYANTGDFVNSGAVLLTIADVSRIRLKAEVDEYDIGKIAEGMPVTVTSDTMGDESLKSKVERISPAAEIINNISIFTVSTVVGNDDGKLRPGMSADLSILVDSSRGVLVPSKAISTLRGRSYVKVYENEEVVTKRITIGADDGVNTAVIEGLSSSDIVVLPSTAGFTLTSETSTTGTLIVPITVPGTGGGR